MPMVGPEYPMIAHTIPGDHARSSTAETMLDEALAARTLATAPKVLDFGCGDGRAVDLFRGLLPGADYTGVDIETSPEVDSRRREDARFVSYDGVSLPFDDSSFDLVYSSQVFEHVRHPDAAAAEIARVLVPGGLFVGSLSNLEPYHSYSIFNYTPWGLFRLIEDNGMSLIAMRPGPEGMAMIVRQLTMRRLAVGLAYPAIRAAGLVAGWDTQRRNYLKLRFSGHICFTARRGQAQA